LPAVTFAGKKVSMYLMAFFLAALIGIMLGMVGGGGSILTVPVLVYAAGIDPVHATAYSLFIVGATALVGSIDYYQRKLVELKTAIVFSVPSLIAVYLTRLFIMPAIPDTIFHAGDFQLTKNMALMLLFALLMIGAAYSMITSRCDVDWETQQTATGYNYPLILVEGAVVGVLTGLVGAGGGFLIIPALVLLAKLPMKLAVGTSLVIIAIKSLVGFAGDLQAGLHMEWNFLLLFTGITLVGIFAGGYFSRLIDACRLRRGFGWFVVIMAVFIIVKEIFF
jgi:hypothetical protein